jgi:DNA-binding GntR family transcriptional regulator
MAGRPQQLTSLGNDALAKIKSALVDGSLTPGERVRETNFAERFAMSRTPVREAIHMLRFKGLVTHKDGQLVISRLDRRQIDEIYAMRETLEGMSARLAAVNARPHDVEDLHTLISRETDLVGAQDRAQLNVNFHNMLAVLADNRYLSRAIEDLAETLTLLGATTLSDDERFMEAHAEHQSIVAAIRAGDADSADAVMRLHIKSAWKARRAAMLRETERDLAGRHQTAGSAAGRS